MRTRRDFLKSMALASLAASGVVPAQAQAQDKAQAPSARPNILFLLTDDQRWDALSCMGNPVLKTPNIDALAAGGTLFTHACVTTAICMSSRASIFSGQYMARHGIRSFATNFTPEALAQTYPALLRAAGYRTGFIGKYGVGNIMPKTAFDYWRGFPGQGKYETKDEEGRPIHLTKLMGRQAVEFLQGCESDKPFCLSVSFKAPHAQDGDPRQYIYEPSDGGLYQKDKVPVPETATNEFYESFPENFKKNGGVENEGRVRWRPRFSTPEQYQESVKGYYRLIAEVDRVVGQIREELKARGLDKNTVILFMGDNGYFLGEHGLADKWYGLEEGLRVPLIVYDPRLEKGRAGQRRDDLALNIDIAPTILKLAGVAAPPAMQGRDLMELVRGTAQDWRADFFYEHPDLINRRLFIPGSEGVVSKEVKYLRYPGLTPQYEALYDLRADPHEKNNLAGQAEGQALLKKMRVRCETLKKRAQ